MFVALVGPDGAGKTTVARALEAAAHRRGQRFAYVHWVPSARSRPPTTVAREDAPPPGKRPALPAARTRDQALSVVRLGRNLLRFWMGYRFGLRRHIHAMRGAEVVVVADRWIYNYVGQPSSVAYYGPSALANLAVRLAPQPDLTVFLDVPAEVACRRKRELTIDEAEIELARWRVLATANPWVSVDATDHPDRIASHILAHLVAR